MILVPMKDIDVRKLDVAVKLFKSVGFAKVRVTDAENHDRIIAYTSELAHVLSNAYMQEPDGARAQGIFRGELPRPHEGRAPEPADVDRAFPREPRQPHP